MKINKLITLSLILTSYIYAGFGGYPDPEPKTNKTIKAVNNAKIPSNTSEEVNIPGIKIINKNSKLYNEVDQTYDAQHGWYWYEEIPETETKDKKNNKPQKKIRYKVTPKEKREMDNIERLIAVIEKQTEISQKMLDILEYNFPRRAPKYGVNKKTGKKCIANSSADCYVHPLVPEAQQIPVMAKFLKNPNMENATEYLKWQAEYMNHISNIGYGLSFAYKQGGKDVYPTNSVQTHASPTGLFEDNQNLVKSATIKKLAKNITIYTFLGKTPWLEKKLDIPTLMSAKIGALKYVDNFVYVYENENSKNWLEAKLSKDGFKNQKQSYKFSKQEVDPSKFNKFNIEYTPTSVLVYKNPKNKKEIWQKISFSASPSSIINSTYDFLVYNGIIKQDNTNPESIMKIKESNMRNNGIFDVNQIPYELNQNKTKWKIKKDQILN